MRKVRIRVVGNLDCPHQTKIKVDDRVRLTVDFLRNTGQAVYGEGRSRWIVTAIDERARGMCNCIRLPI